jgi:hypothetical protein
VGKACVELEIVQNFRILKIAELYIYMTLLFSGGSMSKILSSRARLFEPVINYQSYLREDPTVYFIMRYLNSMLCTESFYDFGIINILDIGF